MKRRPLNNIAPHDGVGVAGLPPRVLDPLASLRRDPNALGAVEHERDHRLRYPGDPGNFRLTLSASVTGLQGLGEFLFQPDQIVRRWHAVGTHLIQHLRHARVHVADIADVALGLFEKKGKRGFQFLFVHGPPSRFLARFADPAVQDTPAMASCEMGAKQGTK